MQKKAGMAPFPADVEKFFVEQAGSFPAPISRPCWCAPTCAAACNTSPLWTRKIEGALEDFIPPSYPTEIDLQNMVAVLECTSKSLLPKQYRDVARNELIRRTNELLALSRLGSEG